MVSVTAISESGFSIGKSMTSWWTLEKMDRRRNSRRCLHCLQRIRFMISLEFEKKYFYDNCGFLLRLVGRKIIIPKRKRMFRGTATCLGGM